MAEMIIALNLVFVGGLIVYGIAALFTFNLPLGILAICLPITSLILAIIKATR